MQSPESRIFDLKNNFMETFKLAMLISMFVFHQHNLQGQAQPDPSYIRKVNKYTTKIDSLIHAQKLQTGIMEGTITRDTMKIVYNVKLAKNDTTWNSNNVGGFSIEYSCHGDTVFEIFYHDNVDNNIYETYYFRNKQLICSKVEVGGYGFGAPFYQGTEYYRNGKIVHSIHPASEAPKDLHDRVGFSWWEKGNEYYEQVKKDRP